MNTDQLHDFLTNASRKSSGKFVIMEREIETTRWRFARYASLRLKMFADTKSEAKRLCKGMDRLTNGEFEHKFVHTFQR